MFYFKERDKKKMCQHMRGKSPLFDGTSILLTCPLKKNIFIVFPMRTFGSVAPKGEFWGWLGEEEVGLVGGEFETAGTGQQPPKNKKTTTTDTD